MMEEEQDGWIFLSGSVGDFDVYMNVYDDDQAIIVIFDGDGNARGIDEPSAKEALQEARKHIKEKTQKQWIRKH